MSNSLIPVRSPSGSMTSKPPTQQTIHKYKPVFRQRKSPTIIPAQDFEVHTAEPGPNKLLDRKTTPAAYSSISSKRYINSNTENGYAMPKREQLTSAPRLRVTGEPRLGVQKSSPTTCLPVPSKANLGNYNPVGYTMSVGLIQRAASVSQSSTPSKSELDDVTCSDGAASKYEQLTCEPHGETEPTAQEVTPISQSVNSSEVDLDNNTDVGDGNPTSKDEQPTCASCIPISDESQSVVPKTPEFCPSGQDKLAMESEDSVKHTLILAEESPKDTTIIISQGADTPCLDSEGGEDKSEDKRSGLDREASNEKREELPEIHDVEQMDSSEDTPLRIRKILKPVAHNAAAVFRAQTLAAWSALNLAIGQTIQILHSNPTAGPATSQMVVDFLGPAIIGHAILHENLEPKAIQAAIENLLFEYQQHKAEKAKIGSRLLQQLELGFEVKDLDMLDYGMDDIAGAPESFIMEGMEATNSQGYFSQGLDSLVFHQAAPASFVSTPTFPEGEGSEELADYESTEAYLEPTDEVMEESSNSTAMVLRMLEYGENYDSDNSDISQSTRSNSPEFVATGMGSSFSDSGIVMEVDEMEDLPNIEELNLITDMCMNEIPNTVDSSDSTGLSNMKYLSITETGDFAMAESIEGVDSVVATDSIIDTNYIQYMDGIEIFVDPESTCSTNRLDGTESVYNIEENNNNLSRIKELDEIEDVLMCEKDEDPGTTEMFNNLFSTNEVVGLSCGNCVGAADSERFIDERIMEIEKSEEPGTTEMINHPAGSLNFVGTADPEGLIDAKGIVVTEDSEEGLGAAEMVNPLAEKVNPLAEKVDSLNCDGAADPERFVDVEKSEEPGTTEMVNPAEEVDSLNFIGAADSEGLIDAKGMVVTEDSEEDLGAAEMVNHPTDSLNCINTADPEGFIDVKGIVETTKSEICQNLGTTEMINNPFTTEEIDDLNYIGTADPEGLDNFKEILVTREMDTHSSFYIEEFDDMGPFDMEGLEGSQIMRNPEVSDITVDLDAAIIDTTVGTITDQISNFIPQNDEKVADFLDAAQTTDTAHDAGISDVDSSFESFDGVGAANVAEFPSVLQIFASPDLLSCKAVDGSIECLNSIGEVIIVADISCSIEGTLSDTSIIALESEDLTQELERNPAGDILELLFNSDEGCSNVSAEGLGDQNNNLAVDCPDVNEQIDITQIQRGEMKFCPCVTEKVEGIECMNINDDRSSYIADFGNIEEALGGKDTCKFEQIGLFNTEEVEKVSSLYLVESLSQENGDIDSDFATQSPGVCYQSESEGYNNAEEYSDNQEQKEENGIWCLPRYAESARGSEKSMDEDIGGQIMNWFEGLQNEAGVLDEMRKEEEEKERTTADNIKDLAPIWASCEGKQKSWEGFIHNSAPAPAPVIVKAPTPMAVVTIFPKDTTNPTVGRGKYIWGSVFLFVCISALLVASGPSHILNRFQIWASILGLWRVQSRGYIFRFARQAANIFPALQQISLLLLIQISMRWRSRETIKANVSRVAWETVGLVWAVISCIAVGLGVIYTSCMDIVNALRLASIQSHPSPQASGPQQRKVVRWEELVKVKRDNSTDGPWNGIAVDEVVSSLLPRLEEPSMTGFPLPIPNEMSPRYILGVGDGANMKDRDAGVTEIGIGTLALSLMSLLIFGGGRRQLRRGGRRRQ